MTSPNQCRPGPPPVLDSEQWKHDLAETMSIGGKGSALHTAEKTVIARFHSPPEFPVWNAIARGVVAEKRPTLGASARVFAMLNLSMADAMIAVYDAKYTYNYF